jgi:aspartate/methionine/tyrosine aminotransferase
MLDEAGVATAPGVDFDRTGGDRYLRFSYAGRRADIEMALERMGKWLK